MEWRHIITLNEEEAARRAWRKGLLAVSAVWIAGILLILATIHGYSMRRRLNLPFPLTYYVVAGLGGIVAFLHLLYLYGRGRNLIKQGEEIGIEGSTLVIENRKLPLERAGIIAGRSNGFWIARVEGKQDGKKVVAIFALDEMSWKSFIGLMKKKTVVRSDGTPSLGSVLLHPGGGMFFIPLVSWDIREKEVAKELANKGV